MSTLREAALEALEALWFANARLWFGDETIMKAISSLQAALAQPETRNQCGETCERAKLCAVCARGLAQQALRDLERAEASGACEYASTAALRAALEQQERVIRGLHSITNEDNGLLTLCFADETSAEAFMASHTGDADEALIQRAALAQQEQEQEHEQEPVAWGLQNDEGQVFDCIAPGSRIELSEYNVPLYTHPPRREWVGLTEEEIYPLYSEPSSDAEMVEFARAVEQALKERNT
jgi:hypothetical protein